jgi:hypothetical protein
MDPTALLPLLTLFANLGTGLAGGVVNRRDGRNRAIRALYLEVLHNLTVLDALDLKLKRATASDEGFFAVARALRTAAHREILFLLESHPESVAAAEARRQELEEERHFLESIRRIPVRLLDEAENEKYTFDGEDDGVIEQLQALRQQRAVGLLPAASIVVSRVEAMQSLAEVFDATASVRKEARGGVRLRTIRAYEVAIKLAISPLCVDLMPR